MQTARIQSVKADYRGLQRFNEATLLDIAESGISNMTKYWMDDRYEFDSYLTLHTAVYSMRDDFLELTFWANATYGDEHNQIEYDVVSSPTNAYVVIMRFYKVSSVLGFFNKGFFRPEKLKKTSFKKVEDVIYEIIQRCEIRFYSNDPSFYYQGVWEDLERENMAIYRFIGPKGKGIWHDKHVQSGGLRNPNIHVTKHIGQACFEINNFVPDIARNLKIVDNTNMATGA